jgi:hypothetical protein
MTIMPWGEFRPDISDLQGDHNRRIENVLPRGDGYGPIAGIASYTDALATGACRGAFRAVDASGAIALFAGSATKLYLMDNNTQAWNNVSKTAGAHDYALPSNSLWQFAQYGQYVIAVQAGDVPQVYQLGVDTYFADLGGSPPTAKFITVVNEFVLLSGIVGQSGRVQWSARSDHAAWTAGTDESDFQDMPDGGDCQAVLGGEHSAIVLQQYGMRRMTYQPGNPVIFSFDRISQDVGLLAPYSTVTAGQRTFFISNSGFQQSIDGSVPVQIGKERVDNTFLADWDDEQLQLCFGFPDPQGSRVYWAYKSTDGAADLFNRVLCYDFLLDKWGYVTGLSGEFVTALAQASQTLEGLDDITVYTYTGDTSNAVNTDKITGMSSTTGLTAGMWVMGTGIPADAVIVSVDSATQITHDKVNTANGTGVTFSFGGSLDALPDTLDAFAVAFGREIAVFDSTHKLGFLRGDNLEATLETAEQGSPTQQTFVTGQHPITDAETVYGQVSSRQRVSGTREWSTEYEIDSRGFIPHRTETRYFRFRNRIPSGASWTFTTGTEPVAQPTGHR